MDSPVHFLVLRLMMISQRTHLIKTLRPGWSPRTRYSPPRRHARHSLLVSAVRNFAPFRRRSVQQQKLFQMPSIGQIGPATATLVPLSRC